MPDRHRHLIIAGTTRGGSTSLYEYLSSHPDICASSLKETKFFIAEDYPLPKRQARAAATYDDYFKLHPDRPVRMEATPDYLYCPGTPSLIKSSLAQARIVISLRDPLDRLRSWYFLARAYGMIASDMSLDDYAMHQLDAGPGSHPKQPYRSLAEGRYSSHVTRYLDAFGTKHCRILFFEDWTRHPRAPIQDICVCADIDPGVYDDYQFERHNRKTNLNPSSFDRIKALLLREIRLRIHRFPRLHSALKSIYRGSGPADVSAGQAGQLDVIRFTQPVENRLIEYYAEDRHALESILGRRLPWAADRNAHD